MKKDKLKQILEMLHAQWDLKNADGQFFFLKYLEITCDRTNEETYILEDLNLLAKMLEEMEMTYLIDTLEIYDYLSAQKIKYFCSDTRLS